MQPSQKTALLIDDEESVRFVLAKQLDRLGYDCTTAATGEEGLDLVSRQQFDVVVLDIMMPTMSGLRVLERLRAGERSRKLCIVMLTAVVDAAVAAESMKLGADAYVTKPSNLDSLRERLQYAEEHREAVNRGETGRSSDQKPPEGVVDLGEITRDLIQQQMSAFEEATSTPSEEDQPPPRRRWPWSKRS